MAVGIRWWLFLGLAVGCGNELGPEPPGQNLRGTLRYEGTAASEYAAPAWIVRASTRAPPEEAQPHALQVLRISDPEDETPYELRYLLPGRYFVFAELVDLAAEPESPPVGAYPDSCVLATQPEERSVRVIDTGIDDIDIIVRDTLFSDPCFATPTLLSVDICPDPGEMSVEFNVSSSATVTEASGIVVGLSEAWPESEGSFVRAPAARLPAEQQIGLADVTPGDYFAYACLDTDGDDVGRCGEGDLQLVSAEPLSLTAGRIHQLRMDLNSGEVDVGSRAPNPMECDGTSLEVEVRGTASFAPGDSLRIWLFDEFPSARPPDYRGVIVPMQLPARVRVPARPSDYHIVVCLLRASSPTETCMNPGDRLVLWENLLRQAALTAGETTRIEIEL